MLAAGSRGWPTFNRPTTPIATIHPSLPYNETMDKRYAEYRQLTSGDRQ
jgi:hypothetical protein